MRYAARRDTNEQPLIRLAERLGAHWLQQGPLDGWILFRGQFRCVEIKRAEREGLAWEYTPAQKKFFAWCRVHGGSWWVWRAEADVMRDLGARVSA